VVTDTPVTAYLPHVDGVDCSVALLKKPKDTIPGAIAPAAEVIEGIQLPGGEFDDVDGLLSDSPVWLLNLPINQKF